MRISDWSSDVCSSDLLREVRDELELVQGASHPFDLDAYLAGRQTPVFFGSAVNNFGVQLLLDSFVRQAPSPRSRETNTRMAEPAEPKHSGLGTKNQAKPDPHHPCRTAIMIWCSGQYVPALTAQPVSAGIGCP